MYKAVAPIERLLAEKLVDMILAVGQSITVWNGGNEAEIVESTDRAAILDAMGNADEDKLVLRGFGGISKRPGISLIYGNRLDLIGDHSVSLTAFLAPLDEWIDSQKETGDDDIAVNARIDSLIAENERLRTLLAEVGTLHDSSSLFLREHVADLKGSRVNYRCSMNGAVHPLIESGQTGRYFAFRWQGLADIAIEMGIDRE